MHPPRTLARLARVVAIALLALGGSLVAGATPAHAAVTYNSYFVYDKNPSDPTNSTLHWYVYRTDLDPPRLTTHETWRAGSGIGGTGAGKNDCATSRGWLPNGWYSMKLMETFNGSRIKGVVFQLNNKECAAGGTTRTELFVHSEMTSSGGQSCPTSGDDPFCWEGNGDYKSEGCIKLKPADIKEAASYYKAVGNRANVNYSRKLLVTS
jgi:hypothetical protein